MAEKKDTPMTDRRPLIAGNWKMNCGAPADLALARAVASGASATSAELVVAPPFTLLAQAASELSGGPVALAAQNVHQEASGAYTGEVSASMLKAAGVQWVIIGHSERRQYFGETDDLVLAKTRAVFAAELKPMVCIGETLEERESGRTLEVVFKQLDAVAGALAEHEGVGVIAYEPVWAIGTGKVATPEQADEVHAAIRERLALTSGSLANNTRILYGGSVKPGNAVELMSCTNIDGALVGGASLNAEDFLAIATAAK